VNGTILLIDDSVELLRLVQLCLERAGYQVVTAVSGSEGLQKMYEHQPDLVILDIMMPGKDGWETCRHLREISDVPIIMLTAKSREQDVVRGLKLGADDYITKPFRAGELLARVQAVLRRAQQAEAGEEAYIYDYDNGRMVIDLQRRVVTVRGKPVSLTPTEFHLLSCLARNAGRVVPHKTLLSQVWGREYEEEVHYLKLYIHYLRQKLEDDPRHPRYLLTEWGVGYCLRDPATTSDGHS